MYDYHTAIVFQGGGGLGAYEYGVIKALYEQRPNFRPAVVTGISIGAINAAILVGARKNPLEALEEVWRSRFAQHLPQPARTLCGPFVTSEVEQYFGAFGNAGMYQLRPDFLLAPLFSTSIYDTAPLRRTLQELVDPDKLNHPDEIRLVLGAINVETGQSRYFDNRGDRIEIDHIIASGSIPPAFPATPTDGKSYWDGGLFLNTPLSSAINCLEQIEGDVRRELIVVELFPMDSPLPRNMWEVTNRLSQLLFTSKLRIDGKLFDTINKTIDFIAKLAPHIPSEFKSDPAYQDIFVKHKKIDALTLITANFSPDKGNPGDFSADTIAYRIKVGYEDARKQDIGVPHAV
jgi:NTE family protein